MRTHSFEAIVAGFCGFMEFLPFLFENTLTLKVLPFYSFPFLNFIHFLRFFELVKMSVCSRIAQNFVDSSSSGYSPSSGYESEIWERRHLKLGIDSMPPLTAL